MKKQGASILVAVGLGVTTLLASFASHAKQVAPAEASEARLELSGEQAKEFLAVWSRFLVESSKNHDLIAPTDVLRYTIGMYQDPSGSGPFFVMKLDGRETKKTFFMGLTTKTLTVEMQGNQLKALMQAREALYMIPKIDRDLTDYRFIIVTYSDRIFVQFEHSNYFLFWPTIDMQTGKQQTEQISTTFGSFAFDVSRKDFSIMKRYILE